MRAMQSLPTDSNQDTDTEYICCYKGGRSYGGRQGHFGLDILFLVQWAVSQGLKPRSLGLGLGSSSLYSMYWLRHMPVH